MSHRMLLACAALAACATSGGLGAQGEAAPAIPIRQLPAQATGGAQSPPSQDELIKLRDEKLALPVFKKADWTFDYDQARERAKQQGKLIFTYFSRSYAH